MRDPSGSWWVVDYGPFASFSSLAVSSDENILLVGDEASGTVIWWDALRHKEIGSLSEMLPNVESLATMLDGSILAVQESQMKLGDQLKGHNKLANPGRVVRINPETEEIETFAKGFGLLEDVAISEISGKIYVTEDNTGRLIELRPKIAIDASEDMLARTIYSSEVSTGRAPAKWPKFIESFVNEMGVATEDEHPGMARNAKGEIIQNEGDKFTLEKFAEKIPLVAGKLKVTKKMNVVAEDPIKEINFMMLYPDSAITQNPYATPSLSLFAIKTESGKVIRTRMLSGYQQGEVTLGDGGNSDVRNGATLFIPLGNVAVMPAGREAKLTLSFMGIDMMDDFYIQLHTGRAEKGVLTVDAKGKSELKESYEVTFVDKDKDGDKERNLVVAGFNRLNLNDFGWYKLGNAPVPNLLSMNEDFNWFSKRTAGIAKTVETREKTWRAEVAMRNKDMYGHEMEKTSFSDRYSYKPTEVRDDLIPNPALAEKLRKEKELQQATGEDDLREANKAEERRAEENADEREVKSGDKLRRAEKEGDLKKAEKEEEYDQAEIIEEDDSEHLASVVTNIILTKAVELWQTAEF